MGLVDYSDSEASGSEAEAPVKPTPKAAAHPPSKKPFQKVVDRSNPGKIVVNLPQAAPETKTDTDEPPAKRARTGGGGGLFAGFNSFLPPPKNANGRPAPAGGSSRPKPGVNLKTSAAPGFGRGEEDGEDAGDGKPSGGMNLPPPKAQAQAQPSIPEGQKAEEDVKLVGKPLMFKPLSVARNPQKTKKKTTTTAPIAGASKPPTPLAQTKESVSTNEAGARADATPAPAPAPKKVSLFTMHTEEPSEPVPNKSGTYEPLFETGYSAGEYGNNAYDDYTQYANSAQTGPSPTTAPGAQSLDSIANEMNLTAAERRELFGRGGGNQGAKNVINFNMDKEYQHNEVLRAAGELQIHNPVRAIQGGKHSLRQLVSNVQNQREALEDSFAKGKSNRKEASSRYGW